MTDVDLGSFAKVPITIEPCANGSYIVTQNPQRGSVPLINEVVGFSNFRDLLAFLNVEYAAANAPKSRPPDKPSPAADAVVAT